ncbi:mechanosensitive ion channel family protein [Megalodesulfovibrio paquesii]
MHGRGVFGGLLVCCLLLALAIPSAAAASSSLLAKELSKSQAKDKGAHDAAATPAAILEAPMAPDTVDDLLAKLTDAQVRAVLREDLRRQAQAKVASSATTPPSLEERLVAVAATSKERLHAMARAFPGLPAALGQALAALGGTQGTSWLVPDALGVLLLLVLAWRVERLAARRLQLLRHRAATAEELASGLSRFRQHLVALAGRLTGLTIFALVALAGYALCFDPAWPSRPLTTGLLAAGGSLRVALALLDWLFAPGQGRLRPVPMGDAAARTWYRILAVILGLTVMRLHVLHALAAAGLDAASLILLRGLVGLAGLVFMTGVILTQRSRVAGWILSFGGETPGPLRRQFAAIWHLLALLYLGCVAVVWYALLLLEGYEGPRGVLGGALLAIPTFVLLDRGGRLLLKRIFSMFQRRPVDTATPPKLDEDGQPMGAATVIKAAPPPDVETMRLFGPARAWMRAGLLLFVLAAMCEVWGMGTAWTQAITVHGFGILLILAAGLGIWEAAKTGIQRSLLPKTASELDNPRLNTLLPLLQKVLGVFLLLSTVLMILSQLGVQIGPLLASAGVFGLAIGMGSQTLVKDVVAGVFFLLDDAFRVGDYIQMGKTEGYVIKMSVRNITLQHTLGYVQILPFGQIKDVVNYSRNPIVMKIKIPMPLETDPKIFKKICKKVNESIMADEEFKDDLVEPIKSQGVKRIEDSTLIFGIKYMTKPGKQFAIRREVFSRLYKEFKKHGLTFAAPGVTVYTTAKGGEGEAEAAAASSAARQKAQQQAAQAAEG